MALTRLDGFAPIRDYAALGDGRTVALVARDGSIDWLAIPAMDAPPAFAALLGPETGGSFTLAPAIDYEVSRRYVERTNVLETTFTTAEGSVRVTDALNVGLAGRLAWNELARRVEGLSGAVPMQWRVAPGRRFSQSLPYVDMHGTTPIMVLGDQRIAVVTKGVGTPVDERHAVSGSATVREGERGIVALLSVDGEPIHLADAEAVDRRIDRTVEAWQRWCEEVSYDGPWREEVLRSGLALKLLIYAPSGGIAAAPTTSLPEIIGGQRNFDYRYSWIRDSSFTIDALMRLDLREESHATLSWLLSTVAQTAPDLHVFYSLDGAIADAEAEIDIQGYRDSRPVLSGNGAADQLQLGNFGDLFDSVWLYVSRGNLLDSGTGAMLAELADRACDVWRRKDSGIWELGSSQHYTISKMGCWVALDRAIKLAEIGQLTSEHVRRWRLERDDIHAWVHEHCWSQTKNSYTFYAGTDDLDAATLLAGRTGFADQERLAGTIEAVQKELGSGPLIYRFSEMVGKEGAFLACSFWMVDALMRVGRGDDAKKRMNELTALANDVGLFSEEMDPGTHELLGNFPQGLTHLSLVNAAAELSEWMRGEDT